MRMMSDLFRIDLFISLKYACCFHFKSNKFCTSRLHVMSIYGGAFSLQIEGRRDLEKVSHSELKHTGNYTQCFQ